MGLRVAVVGKLPEVEWHADSVSLAVSADPASLSRPKVVGAAIVARDDMPRDDMAGDVSLRLHRVCFCVTPLTAIAYPSTRLEC
jgi:hypothetical protein